MSARKNTAGKADNGDATGSEKIAVGMPLDPRLANHMTDAADGEVAINLLEAFMAQAGDTFGLPDLPDLNDDVAPAGLPADLDDQQDDTDVARQDADDDFTALFGDAETREGDAAADDADHDDKISAESASDLSVEEMLSPDLPDDAATRRDLEDADVATDTDGPHPIDVDTLEDLDPLDVDEALPGDAADVETTISVSDIPVVDAADDDDPFADMPDVAPAPVVNAADTDDDLLADLMSDPVEVAPAKDAGPDTGDDNGGWDAAMAFEPTPEPKTPVDPDAHPLDLVLPADAIASLDPVEKRLLEADVPPARGADEWGDDLIDIATGADGMAVVETQIEDTRVIEDPDMIDEDVQVVPAKKGFLARFKRSKTVATAADGDTVVVTETLTEEAFSEDVSPETVVIMDGGDVPPVDTDDVVVADKPGRSRLAMLAALVAVIFVLCLGAYGFMTQLGSGNATQVAQAPAIAAPNPEMVVQPITVDPAIDGGDARAGNDTIVTVTSDPATNTTVDVAVDEGDLSDLMADPAEVSVRIDTPAMTGPDFNAGLDNPGTGNIDDLFIRDETPVVEVAVVPDAPVIDPALFVSRPEYEDLLATAQTLSAQVADLTMAIEARDAATIERDAILQDAIETARRAENLALAQNELVIKVIQMEDKMNTAEELVVDLSQRLADVEMNDPADRTVVDRQLVDLDRRIQGLSRDVGLVARMSINGGGRIPVSADTRNRATAQSASPIYDQSTATIPAPNANPNAIPADVKRGDKVEGYGAVLDIVETSGGGKLVVMENGSAIID